MLKSAMRTLAVCAALVMLWQISVIQGDLPHYILPGPARVLEAFWHARILLAENGAITALEMVLGLICGALGGILIALALAYFDVARRLLLPLVVASQALPVFAIAPLLVLWFGFGLASKVVMAAIIIFFPVASTFYDGLQRTDPALLALGRMYRAGRLRILFVLQVPAALPALSSGLRVAAVFAPIGAVIGEWVGSSAGLGFVMLHANARAQTDLMFAALFMLAIMAIALRALVTGLTRVLVPWQRESPA